MRSFKQRVFLFLLAGVGSLCLAAPNPYVVLETNFGDITIELYPDDAPITVDNFLSYVNDGFYNGTVFHRVINKFMIQAGAKYTKGLTIYDKPPTYGPIINESKEDGLLNVRGTISTALSNYADSATSQFFISQVDNPHLDYPKVNGYGHCVFGSVVEGMDVVDSIGNIDPNDIYYINPSLTHFPVNPPVFIHTAYELPCELSFCSDLAPDGRISFPDFAMFASHWLDDSCSSVNGFCDGADLDYSGGVDIVDLALFWNHWTRIAGYEPRFSDLAYDNTVEAQDLSWFTSLWLNSGCNPNNNYCDRADINRDGIVDLVDYSLLSNNWLGSY